MRSPSSILMCIMSAMIMVVAPTVTTVGQDRGDALVDPRREWFSLAANKGKEFEVNDPESVPSLLALEVERADCRFRDVIRERPIRFISYEGRRFAIVFCRSGILGSDRLFDLTNLRRPRAIEFPIVHHPQGFETTSEPGAITWDRNTGVLQAESQSDMCPTPGLRHIYRLSSHSLNFVLVRMEVQQPGCREGEWISIWDSPRWSLPEKTK